MSSYVIKDGELMHYGVPGMKWGKRKAYKYASKANISRASAREWEQKAKIAKAKGKNFKYEQYKENAKYERDKASVFDQKSKGTYSRRVNKYNEKARIATESAKEWSVLAKDAKNKGKITKATKFSQYAKDDKLAAQYYTQKSKKIIEKRLKRRQFVKDVSKTAINRGKKAVNFTKNKLAGK